VKKGVILLFMLLCVSFAEATEKMPWFWRYLEFQPRLTYRLQEYRRVDTKFGSKHRRSVDNFITLSLGGSYDRWAIEVETSAGATRHRTFTPSDIALTGRFLILEDTIGDLVSLSTGVTFTQVFTIARHDISCFYHGGIEAEGHLAIGKETSSEQFWTSRTWAIFGIGCADLGSPWLRADFAFEKNCYDLHRFRFFAHSLFGLGQDDLVLKYHFRGYGPIRHQTIDLAVLYTRFFESGLSVDLGYLYRIYARNCPEHVNQFVLSFLYPFGP
jgi:hypothetical protein